ncbi:SETMAR [Cordylochernes scorpioides]|uniref:SETMAR n=1 Tax=Cordylochernes scorpioides TaxID=51811 RepID=A0ABY6LL13_9ARAC|nr:SETMAR [Cordylochernes scorpioides]
MSWMGLVTWAAMRLGDYFLRWLPWDIVDAAKQGNARISRRIFSVCSSRWRKMFVAQELSMGVMMISSVQGMGSPRMASLRWSTGSSRWRASRRSIHTNAPLTTGVSVILCMLVSSVLSYPVDFLLENCIFRRQKSTFSTSAFLRFSSRSKSSRSSSGHMQRVWKSCHRGASSTKMEDGRQTTRELAKKMKCSAVTHTISNHLQSISFSQKLGACVPHELNETNKKIAFKSLLNILHAIKQHGAIKKLILY